MADLVPKKVITFAGSEGSFIRLANERNFVVTVLPRVSPGMATVREVQTQRYAVIPVWRLMVTSSAGMLFRIHSFQE